MADRVSWSPSAIADVNAIAAYIARDSPAYASGVVSQILNATRSLNSFPSSGRVVPEFGDEAIREKLVYGYRIIYRITGEEVTIVTVIHGKRIL